MTAETKQKLGFWGVVTFALGPLLSSGMFELPGLAFEQIGPSIIIAYVISILLVLPALLSTAEMATAMPKAGGPYYHLDRSMGPLIGTVLGLGMWLAIAFKSAFDFIGLGAYLVLFLNLPFKPVAIALCVVFGALSISGMENVGNVQKVLMSLVVGVMVYFGIRGFFNVQPTHFKPFFFSGGDETFIGVIALIYISYPGLLKLPSIASEVKDPDRNIPYGMLTALAITLVVYVVGLVVIIGVVPAAQLSGSLTSAALAAKQFLGTPGIIIVSIAAMIAFIASANAGITAASRYPLAMSRDNLLSGYFNKVGRFGTPTRGTLLTLGLIILLIIILSPEGVADLGSALLILSFGMLNLAVIVMRESKLVAYDPGFKTPFYPWVQIVGIIAPVILIPELGILSMTVTIGLFVVGAIWYYFYASDHVKRSSAMAHVFKRIGMQATTDLNDELKGIVRERGTRPGDVFERCVIQSNVIWHKQGDDKKKIYQKVAAILSERLNLPQDAVYKRLLGTIEWGETPIGDHAALPHSKFKYADHPELVIIHSETGISVEGTNEPVYGIFVLVGPMKRPRQHLRFLGEITKRAEYIDFAGEWRGLSDENAVRRCLLRRDDRVQIVYTGEKAAGKTISEINFNSGCNIAMIRRNGSFVVPHGNTEIKKQDELILIGHEEAVKQMKAYFEG